MTFVSRIILMIGAVLLAHSCYSAQEFSSLLSSKASASSAAAAVAGNHQASSTNPYPSLSISSASKFSSLPLDITLETIISVAILCLGIVLGSEPLKPISWRVWAGKLEREKDKKRQLGELKEEGYLWLDAGRRKGFLDIRAQRKEFADWVRGEEK